MRRSPPAFDAPPPRPLKWARVLPVRFALLAVLAALVAIPTVGRADMYKCEGRGGELHFTNTRTPGMRCSLLSRGGGGGESRRSSSAGSRAAAPAAPTASGAGEVDGGSSRQFDSFIQEASQLYQLPDAFVRAVVKVESNFNPRVVSHVGAMGLMQLMPRTAQSMGVRDPFDPRQNILGGTRYLRVLANLFGGDLVLTIAAYNAGEGAVMRYRGVPPYDETRRYVRRVLTHYYAFRNAVASPLAAR